MLNHSSALPFATHKFHLSILHHEQIKARRRKLYLCVYVSVIHGNFILQKYFFLFSRVARHFETLQKWKLFLTSLKSFFLLSLVTAEMRIYIVKNIMRWHHQHHHRFRRQRYSTFSFHFLLLSPFREWDFTRFHYTFPPFMLTQTLYSLARYIHGWSGGGWCDCVVVLWGVEIGCDEMKFQD